MPVNYWVRTIFADHIDPASRDVLAERGSLERIQRLALGLVHVGPSNFGMAKSRLIPDDLDIDKQVEFLKTIPESEGDAAGPVGWGIALGIGHEFLHEYLKYSGPILSYYGSDCFMYGTNVGEGTTLPDWGSDLADWLFAKEWADKCDSPISAAIRCDIVCRFGVPYQQARWDHQPEEYMLFDSCGPDNPYEVEDWYQCQIPVIDLDNIKDVGND